ncbi:class II aldolase/adducin family protein [Gordonia soli]|uniref:Putative aldolase class II protein n=1 Tax=Gordonia soli NBRC 108243 TaxID=1223545 RepID=M0QDM4_9ACTN|nr:class II aldolase/adducin family protein [Gordonia soli]GAC66680.1 putative aldolase class II protein [Gordonia soli NBRC 108243]
MQPAPGDIEDARSALVVAGRRLAAAGLTHGTGGNLSVRVDDLVVLTPSGCHLADVTPEQMVVVDLDGTIAVDTPHRPTSELRIHLDVYRHTSARAVAHAHPIASIAVANGADELPAVHYTAAMLGGSVRVAPYAVFGSVELSDAVAGALTDRTAALMRNHGSVAYADSIENACERIELVDWLAEIHLRSQTLAPTATLSEEQLLEVVTTAVTRQYSPFRGSDR